MPPRRVELVFAGVAIAADEIVAARVGRQADEPVRLRAQGRERGTLEQCPGDLFGPQPRHREDGPGLFLCVRRAVGDGAVEAEDLGGGDGANEAVKVVIRARRNRRRARPSAGCSSPAARRSSTGSASGRPNSRAQTRLTVARLKFGFRGSTTQAASCSRGLPVLGQQLGTERHAGLDLDRLLGLVVGRRVFVFAVTNAAQIGAHAAEERREAAKIGLLPGLERVIVALGTVDPDAEEGPRHPRGQSIGRRPAGFRVKRDGDEIGRGVIGPQAPVGDQLA